MAEYDSCIRIDENIYCCYSRGVVGRFLLGDQERIMYEFRDNDSMLDEIYLACCADIARAGHEIFSISLIRYLWSVIINIDDERKFSRYVKKKAGIDIIERYSAGTFGSDVFVIEIMVILKFFGLIDEVKKIDFGIDFVGVNLNNNSYEHYRLMGGRLQKI